MTIEETNTVAEYIRINNERLAVLHAPYNPINGVGCNSCKRLPFNVPDIGINNYLIPADCFEEKIIKDLNTLGSARAYLKELGLR